MAPLAMGIMAIITAIMALPAGIITVRPVMSAVGPFTAVTEVVGIIMAGMTMTMIMAARLLPAVGMAVVRRQAVSMVALRRVAEAISGTTAAGLPVARHHHLAKVAAGMEAAAGLRPVAVAVAAVELRPAVAVVEGIPPAVVDSGMGVADHSQALWMDR